VLQLTRRGNAPIHLLRRLHDALRESARTAVINPGSTPTTPCYSAAEGGDLDFWTYCCINCLHILPELKYLESSHKDSLTVIGVHSAKFDNENETENIRQAILRYDIEHPVLVDSGFSVWQQYAVRAWPTLMILIQKAMWLAMFR